jgi:hypothetical protein
VITQLGTSLAQNDKWSHDAFHHAYVLWWFKKALLDLRISPATLSWINFPAGGYYPLLLTYSTVYLPGIPLLLFLTPVVTYNTLFLLTFFLSGLSAYALCSYLTSNRWAGLLGGIIYAFFPGRVAHALCGHLELISTYLFPLYLLFLIRTIRQPRFSNSLLCGLALAASLLVQPVYIPFLLVLITLVWLPYELTVLHQRVQRRLMFALAGAFGVALLLVTPFFVPVLREQAKGQGAYLQDLGAVHFSADLLGVISPSPLNPVLDALGLIPAYASRVSPASWRIAELLTYAGVVPLALGTLAAAVQRRRVAAWTLVAVLAAVLSLGPVLKLNGEVFTFAVDGAESSVALPYATLANMPLLSLNRAPARINATLMLALAVLAAHGVAWLVERVRRGWREALVVALCLVTLGEFLVVWPCTTTPLQSSPYSLELARSPGRDAILNLPATSEDARARRAKEMALFYQTLHEHPLFDSWVQRSLDTFPNVPNFLDGLMQPPLPQDIVPPPPEGARAPIARAHKVGYVFLFTRYKDNAEAQAQLLSAEFGPPQSTEEQVIIYQVQPGPTTVDELVYVIPKNRWGGVESWNGKPARWIPDSAEFYVHSPNQQRGSLRFTALPLADPERLQVEVNGEPLTTLVIGNWTRYTTPAFDLQPGLNQFVLRPLGGCSKVVDDPRCSGVARAAARDTEFECLLYDQWERCLSILFQEIRFSPSVAAPGEHSIALGDGVRFLGYDLAGELAPGQNLSLTLYWEAQRSVSENYTVFVHLLGPDGKLLAQHDGPPLDGLYSTSKWVAGDIFTHQASLAIPDAAPPGQYDLVAGMYTYPDLVRLPVAADRPYAQDGLIWLQSMEIQP